MNMIQTVHIRPSLTIFSRLGTLAIMKRALSGASVGRGVCVCRSTSTSVRRLVDFASASVNIVYVHKNNFLTVSKR
jgi:hypothetical protein